MRQSQFLGSCALLGFIVGAADFLSGLFVSFIGAPHWLPLPWSDFNDFAESRDGKVFVELAFYARILCYNKGGRFLASYPYPIVEGGKNTGLATDRIGHVFFRTTNSLYVYDTSWRLLHRYKGESGSGRYWRLDENGEAVFDGSLESPSQVVDTLAGPGDFIFPKDRPRDSFLSDDGTRLVRVGNHLERREGDETTVRYASPWILSPLTLPWPALLGWPVTIALAYWANRCREKERKKIPRDFLYSIIRRRRQSIVEAIRKDTFPSRREEDTGE